MCLEIIAAVSPETKGRMSSVRLSQLTGLAISAREFDGAPALHFAVTGICSCDFLADDANFGSETWALAPSSLPALAQAVATLGRECKRFLFIARRISSDRPRQIARISVTALVKLVSENRICNNVLYVVGYSRA
jgi:hypothetical protein